MEGRTLLYPHVRDGPGLIGTAEVVANSVDHFWYVCAAKFRKLVRQLHSLDLWTYPRNHLLKIVVYICLRMKDVRREYYYCYCYYYYLLKIA